MNKPEPEYDMTLYEFDEEARYYIANNPRIAPAVLCGVCLASKFTISYDDYECIANCECGHSFAIYTG